MAKQDNSDNFPSLVINALSLEKQRLIAENLRRIKEQSIMTYNHSMNVGYLCFSIAEFFKEFELDKYKMLSGGLLHDIGKLNVEPGLLDPTYHFNETDHLKMRQHPLLGYESLINQGLEYEAGIALMHHRSIGEYPLNFPNEFNETSEIKRDSIFIEIADMYDAATNRLDNGKMRTPEEVREYMFNRVSNNQELITKLYHSGIFK